MKSLDAYLEKMRLHGEAKVAEIRSRYPGGIIPDGRPKVCAACKGAQWVKVSDAFDADLVPCSRCYESALMEQRADRARLASGLEDFPHSTFDYLKAKPWQGPQWEGALTWANYPEPPLLWMTGEPYVGKTVIAKCIGNHVLSAGQRVLFRAVPAMLDELRAGYDRDGEAKFNDIIAALLDAPVLILDDLGKEKTTPWVEDKLFTLFNHRLEHRQPTVVTTNWTLEDLDALQGTMARLVWRVLDDEKTVVMPFGELPAEEKARMRQAAVDQMRSPGERAHGL